MKKLMMLLIVMFGMLLFVSCDIEDSYVIEEWEVYEFIDDGVILSNGSLFSSELLETDDLTSEDCEIGDTVFVRIYDSGKLEIVNKEVVTTINEEE